jgi:hypothetical protein
VIISASQVKNVTTKLVEDAVEDIADSLATFFRTYMPGVARGANIYDVTSRWDSVSTLLDEDRNDLLQPVPEAPVVTPISNPPLPGVPPRPFVFISYSRRDAKWLTRLQVHLMPVAQYLNIDLWDDTKITSGMNWRSAIEEAITRAAFAIVMVSADFLASEFITQNELPPLLDAAKNRGALILPVILGPSMFLQIPGLSQYQPMNNPAIPLVNMPKAKQEKELNNIAGRVWEHCRSWQTRHEREPKPLSQ